MPKKTCCCAIPRDDIEDCCDDFLFEDFLTIFGDNMAESAVVSPKDWVALYVARPGSASKNSIMTATPGADCLCCCDSLTNCPPNNNGILPSTEFDGQSKTSVDSFGKKQILFNKENYGSRSDSYYKNTRTFQTAASFDAGLDDDDGPQPCTNCENSQDERPCNTSIFNTPEADARCRCGCCSKYYERSQIEGTAPIIFAYKYSGCHIVWFPREFAFAHNPYISQCNGWVGEDFLQDDVNISCQPFWEQVLGRGAPSPETMPTQCVIQVGLNENSAYDSPYFPCGCVPFPHLSGGVYDSVYNSVNVSLKPQHLGYVSYMGPFQSQMTVQEKDCCWCANGAASEAWDAFLKNRKDIFLNTYPYIDQQGKRPAGVGASSGYPGMNCNQLSDLIAFNPGYTRNCFSRGISPFLLRDSAKFHKMAFEIWGHGSTPEKRYNLGPIFEGASVSINRLQKDINVSFRKVFNKKTRLRDQYIGTVHLEHHFECYSYRSDDGSTTVEMQAIQNHCTLLIAPFETYGGRITNNGSGSGTYRWTPWRYDSIKWQMRRGIPRRAIYMGSGIPLFSFDLIRMEDIANKQKIAGPGNGFDGKTFLAHYYRYFHALNYFKTGACESSLDVPGPPEWDFSHLLDSYEYVTFWIKEMIKWKVIRIKDHSIDIAKEVNDIIKSGTYDEENNLIISDETSLEVGGLSEYKKILDLFGVCAGTANANIKPIDIKQKLLNPAGLKASTDPDNESSVMNIFLPRRAILPPINSAPGITGWVEPSTEFIPVPENPELGIQGARYSEQQVDDIPYFYRNTNENSVFTDVLSPQRVVSGLGGTFVIDATGKLTPFGAQVANEPLFCDDRQYPLAIACVPTYFRVTELFNYEGDFPNEGDSLDGITPRDLVEIPDGRVIDLAFKGKDFVVALADFDYGGIGSNCLPGGNIAGVPATENSSYDGTNPNLNGVNIGNGSCIPYEPFLPDRYSDQGFPIPVSFRSTETKPGNAYRLKSWGSKSEEYGAFSFSPGQQLFADEYLAGNYPFRSYADGSQKRRYPGTNAWFIWTAVSAGMKHFAALDDFGGVCIPPKCDNTYGQSTKGLGAEDLDNPNEESALRYGSLHTGFGTDFNYFPHIPRPGYVKEEQWSQEFYNDITLANTCYKERMCSCHFDQLDVCDRVTAGEGLDPRCSNCADGVYNNETCDGFSGPRPYDKTCVLMGKLVRYQDINGNGKLDPTDNSGRPQYTKVDCGHYNTLLLTNENKLEIYGKFVKIDDVGDIIPDQPIVDAFIPDALLSKAGVWGVTYGCDINCNGITHSPILEAQYFPPSPQSEIVEIKSSADYSIAVTNDKTIHIWGDVSMLPDIFDVNSYTPGQTGYTTINLGNNVVGIESISLGVHAFYIYYKYRIDNSTASRVYSHTRYNLDIGTKFPEFLQSSNLVDVSAGYIHGTAIYSNTQSAIGWDPSAFAFDSNGNHNALDYQFKNFSSLPLYFRKQAFFHALPGSWDYSKWLYGGIGCNAFNEANPIFHAVDTCSALAYNIYKNPSDPLYFDEDAARSGVPQYFWMRKDWRRATYQSLSQVTDNGGGLGAGNENKCKPDSAVSISSGQGSNFGEASNKFGTCFGNYGPVWGYSRPLANAHRRVIRTPFGSECATIPCTTPRRYVFVNRTICNNVPYTRVGQDIPPVNAYRSTKDVFQLTWSLFDARKFGECPGIAIQYWSYFKYSERHYYYGYDETDGAWKVFNNPDFLGNINESVIQPCERDDEELDPYGDGLFISGGGEICKIECAPCGFGGGLGWTAPPGYTGLGFTGSSLKNYPKTSPNYARERDVELPAWLITNRGTSVVQNTVANIINLVEPSPPGQPPSDFSCSACGSGAQRSIAAWNYGGAGAYYWVGSGFNSQVPHRDAEGNIRDSAKPDKLLYRNHLYNRAVERTLSARDLLAGVSDGLQQDIAPVDDPSYQQNKKTFIDVLRDPQLTQIERPWVFGNSTKWIPLCWKSEIRLPYDYGSGEQPPTRFYFDYTQPDINEFGIISENLPETDYTESITLEPATLDPVTRDIICTPLLTTFIRSFIVNWGIAQEYVLNEGNLEFNINCKLTQEANTTRFYTKLYKLKPNNEEIFLFESDASEIVTASGIGTNDQGEISEDYEDLILKATFSLDIPEDVVFDSSDKMLIKLYAKYSNCYYQDPTVLGVFLGKQNVSSMVYTRYDPYINDNHVCFSGADSTADLRGPNDVTYTKQIEPDGSVLIVVGTAPITLSLFECCPAS